MAEIMGWFAEISNIITILVTAGVTWAGSFLFYRQRKDSLEIENESKQSEEWRKLYIASQEDSREKDQKIDELRKDINEMRSLISKLERQVLLNSIYRCDRMECPNRQCSNKIENETPES